MSSRTAQPKKQKQKPARKKPGPKALPELGGRMLVGRPLSRVKTAQGQISGRELPWKKPGLSRVERMIVFLEFLPITKGALRGTKMKLLPNQREFVEHVYGRVDADDRRVIKLAVESEPKGNGKTGLLAGLALGHLLGPEAEPRGEVYSAAVDRQQAAIMYNEMEAVILEVPEFSARCNLQRFHKKIEVMVGDGAGSFYEALSSDARRSHGLSPSLFVYDEMAQVADRSLLDGLINGLGKRPDALGVIISTQAPSDAHPLSQLIDAGLVEGADPSTYVQLLAADEGEDPYDEATWRRVNPALGKFLDLKELRAAARRAQEVPMFEPSFLNLRLNMRVAGDNSSRLVTRKLWEEQHRRRPLSELRGQLCYGALDLSAKHDLTSLTLLFPYVREGKPTEYDVVQHFWSPQGALAQRKQRERDLFERWAKAGHLTLVPGPVIRYAWVAKELARVRSEYQLVALGYDRWRIDELKADLAEEDVQDLPLEPFGQGFRDMAPAVEYFTEVVMLRGLRHGDHPVLKSCVANAVTVSDPAGNLKVDKEKSNRSASVRVDGAVTAVMACGVARKHVEDDPAARVDDFLASAGAVTSAAKEAA